MDGFRPGWGVSMRRNCSERLLANRLFGVQAVNRVASSMAIQAVVIKAFTCRGLGAGLVAGLGRGGSGGSFVDSMFYIMIFCKKRTRKGRIMVFGLSIHRGVFLLDALLCRHYHEMRDEESKSYHHPRP